MGLLAISWQRPLNNLKPDMVCVKLVEVNLYSVGLVRFVENRIHCFRWSGDIVGLSDGCLINLNFKDHTKFFVQHSIEKCYEKNIIIPAS